jgi:protoporphyrin/coproporphyrin ferrochelatase
MIKKFKAKWNIVSNWQVLIILLVFSVTGSAALVVRKLVFGWIGITPDTALWIKIPLYILILFPAYQILLLIIGGAMGQFRFFFEFQKKSLRIFNRKWQQS